MDGEIITKINATLKYYNQSSVVLVSVNNGEKFPLIASAVFSFNELKTKAFKYIAKNGKAVGRIERRSKAISGTQLSGAPLGK